MFGEGRLEWGEDPTMFPCMPRKARWSSLGSSFLHTSSTWFPDRDKLQKNDMATANDMLTSLPAQACSAKPAQLCVSAEPFQAADPIGSQVKSYQVGKAVQVLHFGYLVAGEAELSEEGRVQGRDSSQVITAEKEVCE